VYHLQQVADILAAHPGDTDRIMADLDKYMIDNQKRLIDARMMRKKLLDSLSPDDRAAFIKTSGERTNALRQRIKTAVEACPEPRLILHKARPLFL